MSDPVICLGFKDWHLDHLMRCLRTLRAHTAWPIVLADLGSEESLMPMLRGLCDRTGVRLVCAVEDEWSRSRALNLAAAAMPDAAAYIFTDADMLFPVSWFEAAALVLAPQPTVCQCGRAVEPQGNGYAQCGVRARTAGHDSVIHPASWLWLTHARDLDEMCTDNLEAVAEDSWLFAHTTEHPEVGQGAAMIVPGPWFRRVGGFDEFYRVWGAEDNDLALRATWDGLRVEWLSLGGWFGVHNHAWVAHQWHRRDWPTPAQFEQVRRNRAYLAARIAEHGPIGRNTPGGDDAQIR